MTQPLVTTVSKTEWAIRTDDERGGYAYDTLYQPGWGTRFQGTPRPWTKELAEYAVKNTTQFMRAKNPVVVSRESVTVSTEWVAEKPSESDSKDAIEKLAESGALLTRQGWTTDKDGFANYCNICGRTNGTHSYHCNNDR